jgi:hypothetical protein
MIRLRSFGATHTYPLPAVTGRVAVHRNGPPVANVGATDHAESTDPEAVTSFGSIGVPTTFVVTVPRAVERASIHCRAVVEATETNTPNSTIAMRFAAETLSCQWTVFAVFTPAFAAWAKR